MRHPKRTNIAWTDFTVNPWWGCTKISEGCQNCYAESLADGRLRRNNWGPNGIRQETKSWRSDLNKIASYAKETGIRQSVFIGSMMDIFEQYHTTCHDSHRIMFHLKSEVFYEFAHKLEHIDFLFLTKRSEHAKDFLFWNCTNFRWYGTGKSDTYVGISVENQAAANLHRKNMRRLHDIGFRVFVSSEPRLGPIDWTGWEFISCLITGGESGPNARPMHPDYPRADRDWCAMNNVPFFFKQWGEWLPWTQFCEACVDDYPEQTRFDTLEWAGRTWKDAGRPAWCDSQDGYIDDTQCVGRVGKKAAGRLLDGVEYLSVPWSLSPKVEVSK